MKRGLLLAWLWPGFVAPVLAEEAEGMRRAVERSLALIASSSQVALEERPNCFTCHHSGLPVLSWVTARAHRIAVNEGLLSEHLRFTAATLEKGRANFLAGKGQGGQAFSAGSALWTLKLGGWAPDDTTTAVVEYLVEHQKNLGHWKPPSIRPPSEESPFSTTFVVIEALRHYANDAQKARAEERLEAARRWLLATPGESTEDLVFRLWCLSALDAGDDAIREAAQALLDLQRADGGWAQLPGMAGDAYATGTALAALQQTGRLSRSEPACQRGVRWLLDHQIDDGSWHVRSRSKPFQTYFESGYPHGKDQFISITAACWATTALILALPPADEAH